MVARRFLTMYTRSQVLLNWIRCFASSILAELRAVKIIQILRLPGGEVYVSLFPFFLLLFLRVDRIRCLLHAFRSASSSFIHQRDSRIFYCRGDFACGGYELSSCYAFDEERDATRKENRGWRNFWTNIFTVIVPAVTSTCFTRFTRPSVGESV